MIRKRDPREQVLISRFDSLLCPSAINILKNGWEGVFRAVILDLLPIRKVEEKFSPDTGRPTKELYSVTGLLLIMEFFGWSMDEAVKQYMTSLSVQYALNVEEDCVKLSRRTLFRYIGWLRNKEFMQKTMIIVTDALIRKFKINTTEQRTDSSQIFSNMAVWSRKKLLHQIIYRFLLQVKRHMKVEYEKLAEDLRERYEKASGWIFGETSPMKLQRRGKVYTTEEQMGYDMQKLIEYFADNKKASNMNSYKDMVRVFSEQFIDVDGKAELNPHPGGKVLINPSDPDAEIGHKGAGYQVQVAETCSDDNEVQLVTAAIPQGASASDMDSLPLTQEKLVEEGHVPEKLYTDAGYGSDQNYVNAAKDNIELVAPAPSPPAGKVGLEQCKMDENNVIVECPAGNRPISAYYRNGKGRAVFHIRVCNECPLLPICRSMKSGKQNRCFKYEDSHLRNRARRLREATPEFKKDYGHKRTPIEGMFGRLKQFTPLRRVRVRGRPAVFHSIFSILIMHNIMQVSRLAQIRAQKAA